MVFIKLNLLKYKSNLNILAQEFILWKIKEN